MSANSPPTAAFALAILFWIVPAQAAPGDADETARAIKQLGSNKAQERADAAAQLRALGPDARAAIPELIKLLGDQTETKPGDEGAQGPNGRMFPSPGFEAAKTLAHM